MKLTSKATRDGICWVVYYREVASSCMAPMKILGWAHTVNYPDKIDVYQLQMNPD